MQIEMQHVHAEVAGARDADERVHVGAIHVEHGAFGVQNLGDVNDVVFEDAERVGVGDHQGGDVSIHDLFKRARRRARRLRSI